MDRVTTFCRLRASLAPLVRPVLEHVAPIRWVAMKWLTRRQPAEVQIGGLAYAVHPADFGVTFEIASTGDYEPVTRAACAAALKPGDTFIDIGAHVGLFTVPASAVVGATGRVIAFEPSPDNRLLLEANTKRHGCENVEVVAAAVADRSGKMTLSQSRINTGDHRLGETRGRSGVRVQVVALDEWLASRSLVPKVIKMDVQGAEPLVLAGMKELLGSEHPLQVLLEFAPSMLRAAGSDPLRLLEGLQANGFVLHIIDERRGNTVSASPTDIMEACPSRGYVNLHAIRSAV
jgi:FkbM family methyltransferase